MSRRPYWVSVGMYLDVRAWLLQADLDGPAMLEWAEGIRPPETPEGLAREVIWIILCAGRTAQSARTIQRKVLAAIEEGRPVAEAFGYKAKAAAIEEAWRERERLFSEMAELLRSEDQKLLVDWCETVRFIGDDTKWQLAKNIGADVCKPDIHLCRLAGFPDKPRRPVAERYEVCTGMCRDLAEGAGDRIATVDSMLWLACNKKILGADDNSIWFCKIAPRRSRLG